MSDRIKELTAKWGTKRDETDTLLRTLDAIEGALRELAADHDKALGQMAEALDDLNTGAVETEKELDTARARLETARRLLLRSEENLGDDCVNLKAEIRRLYRDLAESPPAVATVPTTRCNSVCMTADRAKSRCSPLCHHAPKPIPDQPAEGEGTTAKPAPVPMLLHCPLCKAKHIDEGEFATKVHHTHSCQGCGHTWRPAVVPTVGVQFLPGFKNADEPSPPDLASMQRRLDALTHDTKQVLEEHRREIEDLQQRRLAGGERPPGAPHMYHACDRCNGARWHHAEHFMCWPCWQAEHPDAVRAEGRRDDWTPPAPPPPAALPVGPHEYDSGRDHMVDDHWPCKVCRVPWIEHPPRCARPAPPETHAFVPGVGGVDRCAHTWACVYGLPLCWRPRADHEPAPPETHAFVPVNDGRLPVVCVTCGRADHEPAVPGKGER